ncbi:MAG: IS1595 family transposase, partial [Pseudomonadota bacterium]|nr:IS1595 family transposase [Pseudomonadota bacterium]
MKLTNCKLNKKTRLNLLEFFVLGVTARAAADKMIVLGLLKHNGKLY